MPVTIDGTNGITTPDLESSGAITLGSSVLGVPSGSAPSYTCRAWVNFNGTSTVAIRASGNVTSITDNGTGDYTVNFTTAMPDANYSVVVTAGRSDNRNGNGNILPSSSAPATGSVRVAGSIMSNSDPLDIAYVMVAIFR
jgi:hypothetical protein